MKKANKCLNCKFYYITWNPDFPKGCRAFKFQSKNMPCETVKIESGNECHLFEEKTVKKINELNLNDPKNW